MGVMSKARKRMDNLFMLVFYDFFDFYEAVVKAFEGPYIPMDF